MFVYVSIGNSDNKLTQRRWSEFVDWVSRLLDTDGMGVVARHGFWLTPSDAPWQGACWCVEVAAPALKLRQRLELAAREFGQDSIAWAEVGNTRFLGSVMEPDEQARAAWTAE